MVHVFYTIIIYPLYVIIQFLFQVFYEVCHNQGIAIIGISAAVTLLCLPLYIVAESWQQRERNTQAAMKPYLARIKSVFHGDEQYMLLSAYYRERHYHPLMSLRSSFGLLIQIPFFIAAYRYLSESTSLDSSFFFIKNLAAPDALLNFRGHTLNVLPVAMTLINCVASAIYARGFSLKEKAPLYLMALIFLVLLYQSPSGLVLYWTMNNVFSLIKNIFYRLKRPLVWLYAIFALLFALIDFYMISVKFKYTFVIVLFSFIVFAVPLFVRGVRFLLHTALLPLTRNTAARHSLFLFSSIGLWLLTGLVIPSLLMVSSPAEYCFIDGHSSPFFFLWQSTLQAFGFFVCWPLCVYFLFGKKPQTVMAAAFFLLLATAIVDCFIFQGHYGTVSAELEFTEHFSSKPSLAALCANLAALCAIGVGLLFFLSAAMKKNGRLPGTVASLLCAVLAATGLVNMAGIYRGWKNATPKETQVSSIRPIIHLSKTERNVIVFMLDRAAGYLLGDALQELPSLSADFTGFTFYPNTVSFGSWTIQGAPGLYGGYDYTPWQMNQRRELPMVEKHNQALSLMPYLFEDAGFHCDVIDPPYPNYDTPPQLQMYDGHDGISAQKARGAYNDIWYHANDYTPLPVKSTKITRNLLWMSFFRIAPNFLRSAIRYHRFWQEDSSLEGIADFIECFAVLDFLPELTDTDAESKGFILIDNEATHDTAFCQAPEYRPVEHISNYGSGPWANDKGYHGFAASLLCLGKWFAYLKQEGVYDNTRIIIISDHGSGQRSPLFESSDPLPRSVEWFNPLLLVKDFDSSFAMRTDRTFMTQADIPALAMDGMVADPRNPFTGAVIAPLSTAEKNERAIISFSKANGVRSNVNNGFKIKDSEWYTVHDDIFEKENWQQLYK